MPLDTTRMLLDTAEVVGACVRMCVRAHSPRLLRLRYLLLLLVIRFLYSTHPHTFREQIPEFDVKVFRIVRGLNGKLQAGMNVIIYRLSRIYSATFQ